MPVLPKNGGSTLDPLYNFYAAGKSTGNHKTPIFEHKQKQDRPREYPKGNAGKGSCIVNGWCVCVEIHQGAKIHIGDEAGKQRAGKGRICNHARPLHASRTMTLCCA